MVCHCNYCVGGRLRRQEIRHSAGMPEMEIPKHGGTKRRKKKHVHDYVGTASPRKIMKAFRVGDSWIRREVVVYDWLYYCEGCGNHIVHRGW